MAETKRLVVLDPDRTLRDQLDTLAELRILGTNSSEVIRVLVARAYREYCSAAAAENQKAQPGRAGV